MTGWLDHLASASGWWLYVVLGGLAFGEAALFFGMVLPGETALILGGYLAERGSLSLPIMLAVAICCAVGGDSVGYEVGRYLGPRLQSSRFGHKVGRRRWDRAEGFLRAHGGKSVFLGRWVSWLRALVPALVGAGRMPYRTFLPWNAAGGTLWATTCVLLGYVFAASLGTLEHYLAYGSAIGVVVVIAAVVGYRLWHRGREHRSRPSRR